MANPKLRMLTTLIRLIFLCIFLHFSKAFAQAKFSISDIPATSADAYVIDPEYNTVLNEVCWQSPQGELWICSLDPITHLFVPADGKGMMVDDSLRPFEPGGWNGPEWMLSTQGSQIVYTKKIGNNTFPAVATLGATGWNSFSLPYANTSYVMGSHDYTDSAGMLLFETRSGNGIKWIKNTDYNTLNGCDETTLGFFAYNSKDICCVKRNSYAPGYINTTTRTFTQISDDTVNAPFMWKDPESGHNLFLHRKEGGKQLVVLSENPFGNWEYYNIFYSPMPEPYTYIVSPEPFVFRGKSYISFAVSQSAAGNEMQPAQIWFVSVNPNDSLMRQVSNSDILTCLDPEPVVFADSVFIYYSEKYSAGPGQYSLRVRKSDTGLGELLTRNIESGKLQEKIRIYPNPSDGNILLEVPFLSNVGNICIQIFDINGTMVFASDESENIFNLDLTFLCAGYYTVKARNYSSEATSKILIRD